jgi:hypothetical protein
MLELKGIQGESLILDGEWLEKLRSGQSVTRVPASSYRGMDVKEISRRKKLFGGGREELLQLTVNVGTFIGLTAVTEKRAEVERLRSELEGLRRD